MENGDPGEVGPPAPRLAETERRQEQDSVTTHAQNMEEIGVLDLLLKLQDAKSHDASVGLPYSILKLIAQTEIIEIYVDYQNKILTFFKQF